jgi:hypothetical protein
MRLTERQKTLIEYTNQWLQSNYLEVALIGVAWCFLDCGCLKGVGFSREYEMVTPFVRVDRESMRSGSKSACANCLSDNAVIINRVFSFAVAWFRPIPDPETRARVKQELFRPLLDREILEMHEGGGCRITH